MRSYYIRVRNTTFLLVYLLLLLSVTVESSSNAGSRSQQKQLYHTSSATIRASPLCVAVVCRDGVLMVALHSLHSLEPLLCDSGDDVSRIKLEDQMIPIGEKLLEEFGFRQLLSSNKILAPRITRFESKDEDICVMCSGWRSDVSVFVEKCRAVLSNTKAKYGSSNLLSLVRDMSSWMTTCEFSDQVRAIDCVALLSSSKLDGTQSPSLYIVSPYSYERLRTIAIGKGSNHLNIRLGKIAFEELSTEEALLEIVKSIDDAILKEDLAYSLTDSSLEINLVKQH